MSSGKPAGSPAGRLLALFSPEIHLLFAPEIHLLFAPGGLVPPEREFGLLPGKPAGSRTDVFW